MSITSPTGVPSLEIPAIAELARFRQWVCWKLVIRDPAKKPTKVPVSAKTGNLAAVNDPATWCSYAEACQTLINSGSLAGIGFVFTADDPYCGIDFDNCRDEKTGVLSPYAQNAVNLLQSYTEISHSGTGIHVLGRGVTVKGYRNDFLKVEIYSSVRYFSVTGVPLPGAEMDINDCSIVVKQLIDEANQKSRSGRSDSGAISPFVAEKLKAYFDKIPALSADLEPDPDKLEALFANVQDAANAFYESTDKNGNKYPSASNRDFALANYAAGIGWQVADIAALLIAARRKHGDDPKLRRDYYALTIGKIMEEKKTSSRSSMPREVLLAAIGRTCNTNITCITKYLCDPPHYAIETEKGAIWGDVDMLIDQRSFRKSMAAAASFMMPMLEKDAWHTMSQQLLDACIEEDVGAEATATGLIVSWLRNYFSDQPQPMEYTDEALREGNPFFEKGDLYVCTRDLERWIKNVYGAKATSRQFGVMMRTAKGEASRRDVAGADGKIIAQSIWKVPEGLAIELGGKAPKHDLSA